MIKFSIVSFLLVFTPMTFSAATSDKLNILIKLKPGHWRVVPSQTEWNGRPVSPNTLAEAIKKISADHPDQQALFFDEEKNV